MIRFTSGLLLVFTGALPAAAQWIWTPETGRFVNLKRLPKETPELQIEFARSLMVGGKFGDALKETNKFQDFYGESELADENQFLRGEIKMHQEDWLPAAREFQSVVDNYPDSALFDDVIKNQYAIGDSLFEQGVKNMERAKDKAWYQFWRYRPRTKRPLKRAVDVYTMVKGNQPFTPEAAQAQYKIGQSYFAREAFLDSALEYRLVLEQYPTSDWVDEASYGLIQSYKAASVAPQYDQAPSQLAIDAIADFKGRFPDDARNEELAATSAELNEKIAQQRLLTAKYYETRHLWRSTRIAYETVVNHYAVTEAGKAAKDWLDSHLPDESLISKYLGLASAAGSGQ